MRAEAGEEEAADVAVVVLAADLPGVSIAVGAHELVQLLPDGVHGWPSPLLGFLGSGRTDRAGEEDAGGNAPPSDPVNRTGRTAGSRLTRSPARGCVLENGKENSVSTPRAPSVVAAQLLPDADAASSLQRSIGSPQAPD